MQSQSGIPNGMSGRRTSPNMVRRHVRIAANGPTTWDQLVTLIIRTTGVIIQVLITWFRCGH